MTPKNGNKKNVVGFKNIKFLASKNLNLNKLKINPAIIVKNTKGKIGNYFSNLKNEWEKNLERKEQPIYSSTSLSGAIDVIIDFFSSLPNFKIT